MPHVVGGEKNTVFFVAREFDDLARQFWVCLENDVNAHIFQEQKSWLLHDHFFKVGRDAGLQRAEFCGIDGGN